MPAKPAPIGRRVLIVEDDDHIAMAIEWVLGREGLTHDRVATGRDALPRIRATHPDLVLLDVMLPEMSGHDICRDLRRDPSLADVRVLMMTARGSAQDRRRAIDEGADAFVTKPFDVKDLRAEVIRLLSL
ncbi:response regulator [Gemmobacter aquaticus]|jgi:two-component system phosphate regulon response regulator PhoB|nr:response regulator [Gemmobacter aquaticus]